MVLVHNMSGYCSWWETPRQTRADRGGPKCPRNRKKMTEVNIDELQQACYVSLSSPPASPEAERLLHNIIDIITITEQHKRARQPIHLAAFKSAVGLIVGDLLVGLQTSEAGWSYSDSQIASNDS